MLKAALSFIVLIVRSWPFRLLAGVMIGYGLFMALPVWAKAILELMVPMFTALVWYRLRREPEVPLSQARDGRQLKVRYSGVTFELKVVAVAANAVVVYHMVIGFLRGLEERPVVTMLVTAMVTAAGTVLVQLWKEKD